MLRERYRRLGKLAAIALFGCLIFAVVFYVTLPYHRFKSYLAAGTQRFGYELEAQHVGPALGIGMSLSDVALVSSAVASRQPTRILIAKATVGVSVLSWLLGSKTFTVSSDLFGGDVHVKVKAGKAESRVVSSAAEMALAEMPWIKNAINLPATGKLDVTLDVTMPEQRASQAKGTLAWECRGCAIGDGKAKLIVAGNPLLAEGIALPRIQLGGFVGRVVLDKGIGRMQDVQLKSSDLEGTVEGEIRLADPLSASRVDLHVRLKLSDSLLRGSETLRTLVELASQGAKRDDGFLAFHLTGSLGELIPRQPPKTSPLAAPSSAAPAHAASSAAARPKREPTATQPLGAMAATRSAPLSPQAAPPPSSSSSAMALDPPPVPFGGSSLSFSGGAFAAPGMMGGPSPAPPSGMRGGK